MAMQARPFYTGGFQSKLRASLQASSRARGFFFGGGEGVGVG